jgi:2-polyprenyl-3-methyl-5-hydroxy-6-metoxy-1,4-benzoquinol methylase
MSDGSQRKRESLQDALKRIAAEAKAEQEAKRSVQTTQVPRGTTGVKKQADRLGIALGNQMNLTPGKSSADYVSEWNNLQRQIDASPRDDDSALIAQQKEAGQNATYRTWLENLNNRNQMIQNRAPTVRNAARDVNPARPENWNKLNENEKATLRGYKNSFDRDAAKRTEANLREASANGTSFNDYYALQTARDVFSGMAYNSKSDSIDQDLQTLRYARGTQRATMLQDGTVVLPDEVDAKITELEGLKRQAWETRRQQQYDLAYANDARFADVEAKVGRAMMGAGDPAYQMALQAGEQKYAQLQQQMDAERQQKQQAFDISNPEAAGTAMGSDFYTYRTPTSMWNEQQVSTYMVLLGQDEEQAYEYAIRQNRTIRSKLRAAHLQEMSDWGREHPGLALAGKVGTMATAGWDYMGYLGEYGNTGVLMPVIEMSPSDWGDAWMSGGAQGLNEKYGVIESGPFAGKGWGDVYQIGESIAESQLASAVGKAAGVSLFTDLLFFGVAAKQGALEAMERGADPGKALLYGAFCGAAEAIGEHFSIEALINTDFGPGLSGWAFGTFKQSGVEGSEEVFTNWMQRFFDSWILQDKSQMQLEIDSYMDRGMDEATATREATINAMKDDFFSYIGGAISGGIGANISQQLMVLEQQQVQARTNAETEVLAAVQRAAASGDDEKAASVLRDIIADPELSQAFQSLYGQSAEQVLSGGNLEQDTRGVLENKLNRAFKAEDMDVSPERISEMASGYDLAGSASMDRYVEAMHALEKNQGYQTVTGKIEQAAQSTTEEEARAALAEIAGDKNLSQAFQDLYGYDSGKLIKEADKAKRNAEKGKTDKEAPSYIKAVREMDKVYNWRRNVKQVSMKTAQTKDGQTVNITRAEMKNGQLQLNYEQDGKTQVASLNDLALSDEQKEIFRDVQRITGEDAAAVYNGMTDAQRAGKAADILRYATAFANIRDLFGAGGATEQRALQSSIRGNLSDTQVMQAYEIGKKRGKPAVKERPKSKRGQGNVSLDGGKVDGRTLSAVKDPEGVMASQEYQYISSLAKSLGIDVVIFESRGDKNGNITDINGAYKNGTIYVDWNAGMANVRAVGDRMLMTTMSHELTHFIQQNAPEDYQELKSYVIDYLADTMGKRFNDLVLSKMEREPGITKIKAEDEVIADACETMLRDSQAVQEMMEEHQTLWEKIKNWIQSFLGKIKASDEGAKALQPVIKEVQAIWDRGLRNAVESRPTEVGSIDLADFEGAKTTDGEDLFQVRAFQNDEQEYRNMLEKWGGMTPAAIDSLFETIDGAMDIITSNLEALDYAWEADIDDRGFLPVKQNSDKLYKVSQDFSTLCRKRILQGLITYQLQEALDRVVTREEGIAIRDALLAIQAEGKQIEVACALCYVESARMKSPEQIQKFLDNRAQVIREFFAGKDKAGFKQIVAEAEAREREAIYKELEDLTGSGLVKGKGADNTMYDIRDAKTATLNKIPQKLKSRIQAAKRAAKSGYSLSAQQQETVERAEAMSITDFTTPEGLERLAKDPKTRDIFDAYTSYVRNATKSKGIENDTWWRAGDSQTISDLLIEQMNRENGLRTQSWSDFQVKHLMDYIAATIELSTRGAKQHAYTKVPDYVDLMGNTGVMINMSLIPTREFNGKLRFDDVEGFVYQKALDMRIRYHETAGTICIGVGNEQIKQLLESDAIDYVIPYHHSGMAAHIRKAMHIPTWDDYQDFQNEKALSGDAARKNAEKYGVALLSESDKKWHQAPVFHEWFDLKTARQEAKLAGNSGEYGIMTGGYIAMQNAAKRYMKICAERGLAPKFSYGRGDFSNEANYWKLLIDRKMVDNVTGEVLEQKALKPVFKMSTIERILNDELERYGRVKEDQDEAIRRVSEAFLSGKIKAGMKSEDIAKVMQKPVDNISIVNITQNAESAAQMSLRPVAPVQPSDGSWQRGHTEEWFRQNGFPIYSDVPQAQREANEDAESKAQAEQEKRSGGHGTQIGSTEETYRKLFESVKKQYPDRWQNMRVLDASSGLGYGTRAGRAMGFNVTDIEPFWNRKKYDAGNGVGTHPDYEDYSYLQDLIDSGEVEPFDLIISNAVLNVVPQDTRDDLTVAMGQMLKPGGQIFVNVISKDYDGAVKSAANVQTKTDAKGNTVNVGSVRTMEGDYSKSGNMNGRGHETFVWKSNSVQKVFSYPELVGYLRDALGPGYTFEKASLGMTGVMAKKNAETAQPSAQLSTRGSWNSLSQEEKDQAVEENRAFNERQTETGSALVTLKGSTISRGGTLAGVRYSVGKVIGGRLYIHKSYADYIGETDPKFRETFENAKKALQAEYPDFEYNCINYHPASGEVQFQEAPDFDTAREPVVGMQINVQTDGTVTEANRGKPFQQIWHHKWQWVGNDYKGFNVRQSWEWSKQWLSTILGASKGGSMRAWNEQLAENGLPEDTGATRSDSKGDQTQTQQFKKWFGNSKVVDEDGKPLVVYHGTEADFTVFDRSKGRSTMDIQGMFFSPWEIEADGYGSKVGAYYLSIQNPAPEGIAYKALNMFKGQNNAGIRAREYLEARGYDGVQGYDEWIAFRPEQIKSATDNTGAFDRNNPDVRFSVREARVSDRELLEDRIKSLEKQGKLDQKELQRLYETVYDLSMDLDKAGSDIKSHQVTLAKTVEQLKKYQQQAEKYHAAEDKTTAALDELAKLIQDGADPKVISAQRAKVTAAEKRMSEALADLTQTQESSELQDLLKRERELQRKRTGDKINESVSRRAMKKRVTDKAAELSDMLLTNSDKMHVPEILKGPLAEFLESINFTSKRALEGGEQTKADQKFAKRLMQLRDIMENQSRYIGGDETVKQDLGGYLDISEESMEFLRNCAEMVTEAMGETEGFTINTMDAEQLKDLANFLTNLKSAIRGMNSFMANARFQSVREAAAADIAYFDSMTKTSGIADMPIIRDALWRNGTPYYIFNRFGEGGKSIFQGFTKGWAQMAFDARSIIDFTARTYTDKEVQAWKKETHYITLEDGQKIQMTTAQIMEFAMLLGREQAVKHIEHGGIRIGDVETKGKTRSDTEHYNLSGNDIQQIIGILDARQMDVAKRLQKFMADTGAEWGNEVSMKRFGYKFYDEGPGYYPIKTDATDRPMADTDAQMNSMFRLLNLSSSKKINPRATNALVVGDIFETFADHMADMAKLHGMGLPVLDAIKWFNYKERIDNPDGSYTTKTVQRALERALGKSAGSYFRTLIKDINGQTENGDRGTGIAGFFTSKFKASAVGGNLRVALLQPTAYVRALVKLKPQYMALAMGNVRASAFTAASARAAWKEAMKYSGEMVWKDIGGYNTDLARSMRAQIQHADGLADKITEASMLGAEWGDRLTWGRIWAACKMQAKAENKGESAERQIAATEELFREVIYSSQVMDSTLTRSELMRSRTMHDKLMTAFLAEPTLSYNILMDAVSSYRLDVKATSKTEAWRRNRGKLGIAFTAYLASAGAASLVESLADAFRDDDDEEFIRKYIEAMLGDDNAKRIFGEDLGKKPKSIYGSAMEGNLAQDLSILGKLPYAKDLVNMLAGYKASNMSLDAFKNLINVGNIWMETYKLSNGLMENATDATYNGKMTTWGKIYKSLQAASQLTGLPAYNVTRDVVALWNTIMNGTRDDWKILTYDPYKLSQKMVTSYDEHLADLGISKRAFRNMIKGMDVTGDRKISQDEAVAYLQNEENLGTLTHEQAVAVWATIAGVNNWQKEYEMLSSDWTLSESRYNRYKSDVAPTGVDMDYYQQILTAMDANENNKYSQSEAGPYLQAEEAAGRLTHEQAVAIWNAITTGTTGYDDWLKKQK